MDRYSNFADSSEAADLPWDVYFHAVLLCSGSSENIPSVNTSHSPSPFSAVQDDDIINSVDTFNSGYSFNVANPHSTDYFSTSESHSTSLVDTPLISMHNSCNSMRHSVISSLSPKKA